MVINSYKCTGIKPMLIQFFSDDTPIKQATLRRKVEADIITVAEQEGFIKSIMWNHEPSYCITQDGKTYRDE